MRASHILAALGATTTALAQNTSPLPDAVAQSAADCTSSSATTTWSLPSVSATSTHVASFTLTLDPSPANGTSTTAAGVSSGPPPITTTTTTPADSASSSASPTTAVAAAAAPGEGLSTDSSMLGLVVFFALSLCLL
ncbi:hypothetical protein DHEL01_v206856 [Diaporthe helianthi]|uniref:Uncharacterized protein n=1 Tax=Diaporthe helianthi TaxID=158607 RepID=A0A2P5HWX5_DIAHE|nr:hypothetical protein DHEL01_v206856 [Diaporthe helianthi]